MLSEDQKRWFNVTKIKINGYAYDYQEKEEIGDSGHLGQYDYEKGTIQVKKMKNNMIQRVSLAHELAHGFFITSGFSFDSTLECERVVDIFANSLIRFIDDNPKFVREKLIKK